MTDFFNLKNPLILCFMMFGFMPPCEGQARPIFAKTQSALFVQAPFDEITLHSQSKTEEESPSLKERLRIQNYFEWMFPSFAPGVTIPTPDGNSLTKGFIDGRIWMDYALSPKFRLLFWQRYVVTPQRDYYLYDPRLGIRLTQFIDIPELTTVYDFYFLPGITTWAHQTSRLLEMGIRTNTLYSLPHLWDIGLLLEINGTFYQNFPSSRNLWGTCAPYAIYKFSKQFSTQHWFVLPYKFQNKEFSWDTPGMPFFQNGVGWSLSSVVWIGLFVNNYAWTLPTLRNTWTSFWINLNFL